jgi:hypothetical protein
MPEELVIYPRVTAGWAVIVLASAAGTAGALYVLLKPTIRQAAFNAPNIGAFLVCSVVFGSYTVIALVQMFGREALILDQTGFTKRELWSKTHRWEMVSDVRVVPKNTGMEWLFHWLYLPTVIEFRDRIAAPPDSTNCCIVKLDRLWGHSSEELARTLNDWRAKALARKT